MERDSRYRRDIHRIEDARQAAMALDLVVAIKIKKSLVRVMTFIGSICCEIWKKFRKLLETWTYTWSMSKVQSPEGGSYLTK